MEDINKPIIIDVNSDINDILNNDDDYIIDENIDINEYIPANDELEYTKFVDILNIFNCYYKQLNEKNQESTLFDNIDFDKQDSTNKCLEFLYDEMNKFNKSHEQDKDILYEPHDKEVDIEKWKEMYVLYIESNPKYVCKYLLPLLQYLVEKEWFQINWNIKPFKN